MLGINITSIKHGIRINHSKYGMGTVIKDPDNLIKKGEAYIKFDNGTDIIDKNSMGPDHALWQGYCQNDIVNINECS